MRKVQLQGNRDAWRNDIEPTKVVVNRDLISDHRSSHDVIGFAATFVRGGACVERGGHRPHLAKAHVE